MKTLQQILSILGLCLALFVSAQSLPQGFEKIEDVLPDVVLELRYAGTNNFMGRQVRGYASPKVVLTTATLVALKQAQQYFSEKGLGIKLFDGYRPQKAVDDFVAWAKIEFDTLTKSNYYPKIAKNRLFEAGYIAHRSGHSRGSTIDITLVYTRGPRCGEELDMGSPWDFFGPISWVDSPEINATQKANRLLLLNIMTRCGFRSYSKEWWHFTLNNEPFPDTYFDF